MNEQPPEDAPDELEELYRRTAALDPSRPSESARRSILDHAARLANERTAAGRPTDIRTARRASRRTWPALVGALAAALLAGLVVIPRFWSPPPSPRSSFNETAAQTTAPPAQALEYSNQPSAAAKLASPVPNPPEPPVPSQVSPVAQAAQAARNAAAPRSAAPTRAPSPAPNAALDESSERLANVTVTGQRRAPAAPLARPRVDAGSPLLRAAQAGDILALNWALGQPIDVNERDSAGRTALMLAILNGHGDVVDALLAHGADPNLADATGTMPLAVAEGRADPSIVAGLRRAGARENQ